MFKQSAAHTVVEKIWESLYVLHLQTHVSSLCQGHFEVTLNIEAYSKLTFFPISIEHRIEGM